MGSDQSKQFAANYGLAISIHAPAWGATYQFFATSVSDSISIHAPAWGATAKT